MGDLEFSIVIPYKQRRDNLKITLETLTTQTADDIPFEVVVGVMEYAVEYVELCREFADRLRIVSVLADEEWSQSTARNLALTQACGRVVVFLDADMAVPREFLRNLRDRHFAHGQNVCVVGQAVGYEDVIDTDAGADDLLPHQQYRDFLAELESGDTVPAMDERWTPEFAPVVQRCPWALVRSGLVALPRTLIEQHRLYFDEGFRGWGPEDQEWGLRISLTGTPILFQQDVYAVHMPHPRDTAANGRTAWLNNRYYLRKWPRRELELALSFGWTKTAHIYADVEADLSRAAGSEGALSIGVVRARVDGRDTLLVGAPLDARSLPDIATAALLDVGSTPEVFPLAGFGLPYEDSSVEECRVLAPISLLREEYRTAIIREARRAAKNVVIDEGTDRPDAGLLAG
ncbi:glycosyltransferase family A protein [Streptomyces prunicolor]